MQAKAAGEDYRTARARRTPLTSEGRADTHMGYVSESFEDLVDAYLDKYAGTPGECSAVCDAHVCVRVCVCVCVRVCVRVCICMRMY
jgi:hypothetical protein